MVFMVYIRGLKAFHSSHVIFQLLAGEKKKNHEDPITPPPALPFFYGHTYADVYEFYRKPFQSYPPNEITTIKEPILFFYGASVY